MIHFCSLNIYSSIILESLRSISHYVSVYVSVWVTHTACKQHMNVLLLLQSFECFNKENNKFSSVLHASWVCSCSISSAKWRIISWHICSSLFTETPPISNSCILYSVCHPQLRQLQKCLPKRQNPIREKGCLQFKRANKSQADLFSIVKITRWPFPKWEYFRILQCWQSCTFTLLLHHFWQQTMFWSRVCLVF